jgi:hypothetical protein
VTIGSYSYIVVPLCHCLCKTLFLPVSIYNIQTTLKKQQMYGYAKGVNGVSSPVLLNNIRNITYSGSSIYIEYIGATSQAEGNVNIVLSSPVVSLQTAVEHWIRDNSSGKGANSLLNDYISNVEVNGVFNAGATALALNYEEAADLAAACAISPSKTGYINQNSAFSTPQIGNSIFQSNSMLLPIADGNYSVVSGSKFLVTIANSIITYVELCPVEIQKVFAPNEWDNRLNGSMSYTGCFLTSMGGSSATSQWFDSKGSQPWIGLTNIPEISNSMGGGPTGCDRSYLSGSGPGFGESYAAEVYYSNVGPSGPWYIWGSWNSGNPYPLGTSSMSAPIGSSMSSSTFSLPAFQHTAGGVDYTFPKNAMNGGTFFCGGTAQMYISSSGTNQGHIVMSNTYTGCGIASSTTCVFPCP